MKNGSFFILLVTALAALAMSAGAEIAPMIQDLPDVVIGAREDVDAVTGSVLLRYANGFSLNEKTYEPNTGNPANLRFWYEATGAKLKIGTPTIKAPLTPTIVLFGPECPMLYAPLGDSVQSAYLGMHCSPCVSAFNHRDTPCVRNRCMEEISDELILEIALGKLNLRP